MPFDEQLDAMEAVRDDGLIGAVGLSNVDLDQYRVAAARIDIACVQNPYNLVETPDADVFDACRADGVAFVPFFPLGSAFHAENPVLTAPPVVATAQRLGATPAQMALAWLLHLAPNVLLIPGTSSLAAPRGESGRRRRGPGRRGRGRAAVGEGPRTRGRITTGISPGLM